MLSQNGGQLVLGLSSEIFGQKTLSTVSYEMDAACSAKMQHMSQLDENITNQVSSNLVEPSLSFSNFI
jgi:hypothetical protein